MNPFTLSRHRKLRVALDVTALDAAAREQWLALIAFASRVLGRSVSLESFSGIPPEDGADFAYVTGSAALSRKLWLNVPAIYIQPRTAPTGIDAYVYWKAYGQAGVGTSWRPLSPSASLITSVFDGDAFLAGFLENCAGLHGYRDVEHFLIRAGSPGTEHVQLVEHVRRWPSAVYLNLRRDPGLYEVWNLGVRLARGRYLSNANIDDRRAPEHLSHLRSILDRYPDVDVASTALRVTSERNLTWQNSERCPVWFADKGDIRYAVDGLFREKATGLGSNNLPNCMPLWRRSLHARVGLFDGKRYDPSADWAFWVRAGMQGSRFYLSAKPLGLYLRDENSYWHRDPASRAADERIVSEYLDWLDKAAGQEPDGARLPVNRPKGSGIGEVIDLLRGGAVLEGAGALLQLLTHADASSPTERTLIRRVAEQYLARADLQSIASGSLKVSADRKSGTDFLGVWTDLVHGAAPASPKARRTLELGCVDLSECLDDFYGLLLLAFLARRLGDDALERELLRHLHGRDRTRFWKTVQQIYRFTVPLPELCEMVSDVAPRFVPQRLNVEHQVVFYPKSAGNTYQELLYRSLSDSGAIVWGATDAEVFLNAPLRPGVENVLHLHWVHGVTKSGGQAAIDRFLEGLEQQKKRGFRIFWTVHNYLGHDTPDAEAEIAFRKALYRLCDRVFIHHPLAAELLDWLPDRSKLCLCEHGHYDFVAADTVSRDEARELLGLGKDDFVVAHLGEVRDYKGLETVLPVLLEQLEGNPRMKVVIGGHIQSAGVRSWLERHPHPNLIVRDGYLSKEELLGYTAAADFGLLAYRAILTSGSLVHWFSGGRPVLTKMVGTIPAYLVNGWNGYAYRDAADLRRLLHACALMSDAEIRRMGENARATAKQMEWRMWAQ